MRVMRLAHVVIPVLTCVIGFAGGVYYARSTATTPPAEVQVVEAPPVAESGAEEPGREVKHDKYWDDVNPEESDGADGVLVIDERDPDYASGLRDQLKRDPELKARVEFFENSLQVEQAVRYSGPRPGSTVTDVYLVDERDKFISSHYIHAIQWYETEADQGWKRYKRVHAPGHHIERMHFFDVNGDGNREILTVGHGVNHSMLSITDLSRPEDDAHVLTGQDEWCMAASHGSGLWEFTDLNGDGKCECVARVYHRMRRRDPLPHSIWEDATRYEVYQIENEHYRLRAVRGGPAGG